MDMKGAVWILLLVWSWYNTATATATAPAPAPAPSGGTELSLVDSRIGAPNYPTVRFRVDGADRSTYQAMIAQLREALLTSRPGHSRGIPMLREASSLSDSDRYVLLEMSVPPQQGQSSRAAVTYAISASNVYVVAYFVSTTNTRHFFREAEELDPNARRLLFPDAGSTSPRVISSNYQSLETLARYTRSSIPLGLPRLESAIWNLVRGGGEVDARARGYIIVIQMVAEAVRYWQIELRVLRAEDVVNRTITPDGLMLDLENSWQDLSLEVQRSQNGYAFQRSLIINDIPVDNVRSDIVRGLALMLAICTSRAGLQQQQQHLDQVMMRRSDLEALPLQLGGGIYDDDPQQCRVSSDTKTRITGRDGMCVEVKDFKYTDNNPVVVASCKTSDFRNQLWTWRSSDGRIVSLEKCLTASGNRPGSTVVIRECDILQSGSPSQWRMEETGDIVHIYSNLRLTAGSSELTVETRADSSFQAWTRTNQTMTTAGHDVMIVLVESNKCMYYSGSYVYTQPCSGTRSPQRWKLYPDSTIRPTDYPDWCLELKSLKVTGSYNYIMIGRCHSYPEVHRWIFTHEGVIQNVASKLVVDADRNPNAKDYLQAAVKTGAGNQIWRTLLIS